MMRLKHHLRMTYGDALSVEARKAGEVPVYGSNGIVGNHSRANTLSPAIIVGRKGSHGKVVWANSPGFCIDTAYYVDQRTCAGDLRFSYFLLISLELDRNTRDTGVPGLERNEAHNRAVRVPDLPTQKRIAVFLDRETARIDELIAKKERLVEVLRENLLSGLERLVTPEEPVHEELIPFRWVCRITEGQVDPTHSDWAEKPLIAPNHIESRTGRMLGMESAAEQGAISGKYAFPAGTVLYSKIRPNLAKACVSPVEGMCSADMYPVLPDRRLRPQFLLMQLLSAKFTDWATLESMRVAMPKINRETLGSYRLWAPALAVQDEAATKFFAEQKRNETLTEKVRISIERLREYRAALITAAVTGQIDVGTYSIKGTTSSTLDRIEEEMQA
ncbi:restriction endonuclease subunit S [Sulfitobacter sp. W027]|uniref:restriction endonuclease subunit S n=1 Tax=Sulfitobacter sp. W027 TaxID=2867025 RepID=UPI0021A5936E|nr:restriction endonuclease subunit S [Sulfitobacter sp. W027]UWR33028.1 restriction endonuclease subunit S [Sulfitobacter sp. W027]